MKQVLLDVTVAMSLQAGVVTLNICLLTTQDLDADPFPEDDWPCDPRPFLPEAQWDVATLSGKQQRAGQHQTFTPCL